MSLILRRASSFKVSPRLLRAKSKSPSSLICYKNYSSEEYSPLSKRETFTSRTPNIDKLRTRKTRAKALVTREMATKVIKQFLLPMFETQKRSRSANMRVTAYGTSPHRLKDKKAILKLSDLIKEKLHRDLVVLENVKDTFDRVQKEKEEACKEIEIYKNKLMGYTATLHSIEYQLCQTKRSTKLDAINVANFREMICESKVLYEKSEIEKTEISNFYFRENNYNIDLKDKSKNMMHWNDLFKMQNVIIGERLKGFFDACNSSVGQIDFEDVLSETLSKLKSDLVLMISRASKDECEADVAYMQI